ncbi:hypothetical protein HBB16_18550 [Pseudonocardia sp. MCCB 268]|nr:hypothetical protein [Pseudonocardia cytotoxica]
MRRPRETPGGDTAAPVLARRGPRPLATSGITAVTIEALCEQLGGLSRLPSTTISRA